MSNQLESALVLALRDTIKWESATDAPASGTLTPVNPNLPFDARTYQERDRQLAYRDLILSAAVVEVSIQVGDVWNYSVLKPTLQGPAPFTLPFVGTEAGTLSGQVRHVTNVSIPYDAARYADADLYGRDSVIYEVLARACASTFVDPSIPLSDSTGSVIPSTSIWPLGQGAPMQADINPALPLNRDLFKNPDRNLADRDNQLAGYVAQVAQVLRNPFEHALRLYVQVEAYGTTQREPEIYALSSDDGTYRVFQTEPAIPAANQIVYNIGANTLQWVRERIDEVHVPQIYAMVIPGIEVGQTIETVAAIPEGKDAQFWRNKASQLNPDGIQVNDTDLVLTTTNNDAVSGGYMQYGSVSFTVPDIIQFNMTGSLAASRTYRVSVLGKPNNTVEIAGAQNTSSTSGTLGGASFDVDVASGSISNKVYRVIGGDGIVYNGSTYLNNEVFTGTTAIPTYVQYGAVASTVNQYLINFVLALPTGPWNVRLEYTNLTGTAEYFNIKAELSAAGSDAAIVIQDLAPIPFNGQNGDINITATAGMDVNNTGQFTFPVYWTGGSPDTQLHIRKLVFESPTKLDGFYAMTGTFAGSIAQAESEGEDKVPDVYRWQFWSSGSNNGTTPFTINYTDEALLPIQIQQVHVQSVTDYETTALSQRFQSWRQECLDRAERSIAQSYAATVKAYGTQVPTFRDSGSNWSTEATENWMSFCEVYQPRLRQVDAIATDAITAGRQYQADSAVVYSGTAYAEGQRFYGMESSGSVYSGGVVHQVGAFTRSLPGHIGRPCLVPRGLYFDDTSKLVKAYYDTPYATPTIMACQAWMIEMGLYVAQNDFWMPEALGLTANENNAALIVPIAYFVGAPTVGDFPLSVSFTDLSVGATTWFWDFGD